MVWAPARLTSWLPTSLDSLASWDQTFRHRTGRVGQRANQSQQRRAYSAMKRWHRWLIAYLRDRGKGVPVPTIVTLTQASPADKAVVLRWNVGCQSFCLCGQRFNKPLSQSLQRFDSNVVSYTCTGLTIEMLQKKLAAESNKLLSCYLFEIPSIFFDFKCDTKSWKSHKINSLWSLIADQVSQR